MNLKIKYEMGTFSPLGVKDRRECKRHEKLRVNTEMLKTTSALQAKDIEQSKETRQERRGKEKMS